MKRLFKQTKGKLRQKKTENDALVSSLPSTTLKNLKSKRPIFSREKVAVSFSTDKQLRNIFEKFDVHKTQNIDLKELQAAAVFVEESTINSRQGPLKNIHKIFENMDDDGNGLVLLINFLCNIYKS
jgi:Ca2+-binding EF-hand superfamily protein